MEIKIKNLGKRNFGEFFRLVTEFANYEKLAPPSQAARKELKRHGLGKKPLYKCKIAYIGKTAAGYCVYYNTYSTFLGKPQIFIEDLFVREDARGRGIGKKLFKTIISKARRSGCGRVQWFVLGWNKKAKNFYMQMGARKLIDQVFRLDLL